MAVGVFGMSSAAKMVLCSGLGSALHRHRWLWSSVLQCSRQAATDALTVSMTAEWKSVLTTPEDMCKQEYWAGEQAYWSPSTAECRARLCQLGLMNGARGVVVAILLRQRGLTLEVLALASFQICLWCTSLRTKALRASQTCRAHGCPSSAPKWHTQERSLVWCAQGFLYELRKTRELDSVDPDAARH